MLGGRSEDLHFCRLPNGYAVTDGLQLKSVYPREKPKTA
jgi:hypothetical protein